MSSLLRRLRAGEIVDDPVALVVAHPDDETVGIGGRLACFKSLRLIHLTDGAPRDLGDARREGFADWCSYAAARRAELDAALDALGAAPARRICYDIPDQAAIFALDQIVGRLTADISGCLAVLTHAFEQGHPDHDSAAFAICLACRELERKGEARPERIEFAGYHLGNQGEVVVGRFRPDPSAPEVQIPLDREQAGRKAAAIACFRSQAAVLGAFPLSPEWLRPAPDYDFLMPSGPALYDWFGWSITSEQWRKHASRFAVGALQEA